MESLVGVPKKSSCFFADEGSEAVAEGCRKLVGDDLDFLVALHVIFDGLRRN